MTCMDRKVIYGGENPELGGSSLLVEYLFLSLKFNLALPLHHREGSSPS
jgi:hypothetical protein